MDIKGSLGGKVSNIRTISALMKPMGSNEPPTVIVAQVKIPSQGVSLSICMGPLRANV